jgi:hypothetical protein
MWVGKGCVLPYDSAFAYWSLFVQRFTLVLPVCINEGPVKGLPNQRCSGFECYIIWLAAVWSVQQLKHCILNSSVATGFVVFRLYQNFLVCCVWTEFHNYMLDLLIEQYVLLQTVCQPWIWKHKFILQCQSQTLQKTAITDRSNYVAFESAFIFYPVCVFISCSIIVLTWQTKVTTKWLVCFCLSLFLCQPCILVVGYDHGFTLPTKWLVSSFWGHTLLCAVAAM